MRINSFQPVCTPVPQPVPSFFVTELVTEERKIYDENGNVKSTYNVDVSRRKKLQSRDFVLEGVTTDMFDVETSQKVGTNLHVISRPFYGVDIDSRDDIEAQIDFQLDAFDASLKNSNDVKPINFEN